MSDMAKQAAIFDKILKKEENKLCADCRRKSPSWASLNIGVLICMKCSGIHRGLGVHISKVKSVNLDKWPEDFLQHFQKINNCIANEFWENKLKEQNYEKLQNDDYKLQDLIKDKYERKRYCDSKEIDPMTLIIQGKSPKKLNKTEKEIQDNDVDSSDEDRSTKRNNKKQKGFKVQPETNIKKQKEPLFQINSNNADLFSFDDNHVNNSNGNNLNNNTKQSGFNFINKNNNNQINLNNFNSSQLPSSNINNLTELFKVENNNNLMHIKNKDSVVDEKLKKITDNIDEIYKNPNKFSNNTGTNSYNLNLNNNVNNQNALFNAMNPQSNTNYVNISQPNINIQNSYYNFNQNPGNSQFNMGGNPNLYGNGMNLSFNGIHGLGNNTSNMGGYGANCFGNYGKNQSQNMAMNLNQNYNMNINNNRIMNNHGFLTTNDIYTKKDDTPFTNINLNQNNNNNFLNFSEVKPKKQEDPFSNLVSFK